MSSHFTRAAAAVLRFTPVKGSFWEADINNVRVAYIKDVDDETLCIGKVTLQGRSRFFWEAYEKPISITTKSKKAPKVADQRLSRRMSNAVYNIRQKRNLLKLGS